MDRFRVREIVEFGFVNAFLALLTVPLFASVHDVSRVVSIVCGLAALYLVATTLILLRRQRGLGLPSRSGGTCRRPLSREAPSRSRSSAPAAVRPRGSSGRSSFSSADRCSRSSWCSRFFRATAPSPPLPRAVAHRQADGNLSDKEKRRLTNLSR
jgi:hypothetical protein